MNTLFKQIQASAKIDDLDEAIRPIQETLGQDDGGVASMFFSGPNSECWPTATECWRTTILCQYVSHECQMANLWGFN